MYNICASVLYKDCTTDDFVSFASGLRTNESIDHTTRLHIHHKEHWSEATYAEITENGWDKLKIKAKLEHLPGTRPHSSIVREYRGLSKEGRRLRQFITEGLTVLPNLRVVSTGGIGETIFNEYNAPVVEKVLKREPEGSDGIKILAQALLDLPTVQHYCQAVAYGPLSLPNQIVKPESALKTYTHHQRGTPLFCECLDCHENHSPPIVLGAINRYHCKTSHGIPHPFPSMMETVIETYLAPIIAMFARPDVMVADPETGKPTPYDGGNHDQIIEGTEIELYNYIRVYRLNEIRQNPFMFLECPDKMGTLPAQSLSYFQTTLDAALPERWRGKVVLKDREQAPPCIACGYDFQQEFEDQLERWESSSSLPGVVMCGHAQWSE